MLEKLAEIILNSTDKKDIIVTEDSILLSDLGLSSYDLVCLVGDVEDEFDVEIPDKMIKNLKTVKDVIDFIESQK